MILKYSTYSLESLDVIDDFGWDPPAQDLGGGEPSGLTAWWYDKIR